VIIAAAAAKPMTVLRIVLTPLLLEKPRPYEENTAVLVALPRAAISVRGGRPPRLPRNLLLDHEHGGLYGAGAEPVQGFLAGVSRCSAGFSRRRDTVMHQVRHPPARHASRNLRPSQAGILKPGHRARVPHAATQ